MLWQECLNKLETILPDQEINTWLRTLHGTEHDGVLVLLAPNTFVYQHVKDHHLDIIKKEIDAFSDGAKIHVILQIGASDALPFNQEPEPVQSIPPSSNNNNSDRAFNSQSAKPTITAKSFTNNLNPSMTFDNFVQGKSNQLAVASAKQVGENPGLSYNPLFIYGGVGLGKTHLMHAIGNDIRKRNGQAKVVYLHSERFVNDMITALRTNSIDQFKNYYRTVDALLIDDIQFFAGKNRSVEEFFHTFNALLEGQKQIILTSDRYPRDVEGIDDRLRSRLNWGLTVEIEPPELETRVAILTKKVEEYH